MDRMCSKCTRIVTRPQRPLHYAIGPALSKTFMTALHQRANESPRTTGSGNSLPIKAPRNQNSIPSGAATPVNSPPRGGQVLRRTGPPPGAQPGRGNGPPQGTFLRRTGPPQQTGQVLRRTGSPRQAGRPGAPSASGPQGKQRRRRTADSLREREAEEEPPSDEAVEEYMTKYIDRPENPTERIEYEPKPQEMVELQKDWPNTPLSSTGLSASLIQKIEWLARRIPHGYQTPGQLAEHFQKGNLTRFESEEEKEQVLKIASELAQQRASMLSERKGSEIAADDMGFSELSTGDGKNKLVGQVVKGEFGDLERQRMPFLDSVVRNLRNNQTYHKPEMDKFMAAVQRLMPAQTQRRPQQQAQKKV